MNLFSKPPGFISIPKLIGGFTNKATSFARFGAGAYALCSAADVQALEDVLDASGGDFSIIQLFQADLSLGAVSDARSLFSFSTNVDTNGTFGLVQRKNPTGELSTLYRSDIGGTVASGDGTDVVVDGDLHLIQYFDQGSGSLGTIKTKVDSNSVETLDSNYSRGSMGVIHHLAPAGLVRGPTPTVTSPLAWILMFMVIAADLEGSSGSIATAFASVSDPLAKCLAVKAAVEAAVGDPDTDIIFGQIFTPGSTADYGDDATLTGASYTTLGS